MTILSNYVKQRTFEKKTQALKTFKMEVLAFTDKWEQIEQWNQLFTKNNFQSKEWTDLVAIETFVKCEMCYIGVTKIQYFG